MFCQVFSIIAKRQPDVIVTTGAAPGLAAIVAGRVFGARTLWIDSIANGEELSGSGKLARRLANQCLTQWEHLAAKGSPAYWGAVL
jgi:UDP-N-acetylglucosamine:LPS N-acetylglucosamine transferase